MFKYAKVGDKVWSIIDGWGKIVEIPQEGRVIKVNFYDGGNDVFTTEGKRFPSDKYPTLYWDKIEFEIPKKPLPKLKVDAKVLVWDEGGNKKERRHFKKFSECDIIVCFPGGETSWSCEDGYEEEWDCWELAKEEEK